MAIKCPVNANYHKNFHMADTSKGEPCIVCGKLVHSGKGEEVRYDLETAELVTASEAEMRYDVSYVSIGSECARLPEVRPYIVK